MYLLKKSIFVLKNYGLKAFIKKAIRFPINRLNLLRQRRVEEKARKNPQEVIKLLKSFSSNSPEEVFDFSWNFYNGLIRPLQIKEEFVELLKIFQELNPKYILEIRNANGGSLF